MPALRDRRFLRTAEEITRDTGTVSIDSADRHRRKPIRPFLSRPKTHPTVSQRLLQRTGVCCSGLPTLQNPREEDRMNSLVKLILVVASLLAVSACSKTAQNTAA